jgi:hypothetical protein
MGTVTKGRAFKLGKGSVCYPGQSAKKVLHWNKAVHYCVRQSSVPKQNYGKIVVS